MLRVLTLNKIRCRCCTSTVHSTENSSRRRGQSRFAHNV